VSETDRPESEFGARLGRESNNAFRSPDLASVEEGAARVRRDERLRRELR
jgi:hypothetical protein